MEMPVAVGVILAIIFLISFSEWFFSLIGGAKSLVLDDRFFGLRIFAGTVGSMIFMVIVFMGIAMVNECDNKKREGIFTSLKCDEYLVFTSATKQFFQIDKKTAN